MRSSKCDGRKNAASGPETKFSYAIYIEICCNCKV